MLFVSNEEWDFKKFPNDIVVINLGTNDMEYATESKHDEYIQEYTYFLELIREKNPDSYIIIFYVWWAAKLYFL